MSAIDSQLPSSSGQDRPTDEVHHIITRKSRSYSVCNTSLSCTQVQSLFLMIGDHWASPKMLLRCSLARISFAAHCHIIAMYRYRPLYGDPPAGDYVGDLCCCNTNDSHWDDPDIGLLGYWCHYRRGFYHHIISATYRSLDAFIPATGYRCGYYFYWA